MQVRGRALASDSANQAIELGQELGYDSLDAMLDVVASGEEWPIRVPPPPVVRRVAEAAGAPGQTATDAAPTTRVQEPEGSASSGSFHPRILLVRSATPVDQGPAAPAPPVIPPADVLQFVGREFADVVKQPPVPQSARRGRGGASGVGEVRQGSMVTLPRHTPQGPRQPPPGFPAADKVRDAQVSETASSSRGEPPPVPPPSAPVSAADPAQTARGLMSHLYAMVDLMLAGPLAEYCEDEARELYRRFMVQIRPK